MATVPGEHFTWRGQNTGELLEFLKDQPLGHVRFWLSYLERAVAPVVLYKNPEGDITKVSN